MGQIKIVAPGKNKQQKANARGKLFEKLMAKVLRQYGYKIDKISNVNYSGMEIDIEGKHIVSDTPLYAECKCYETEVDSPKLQAFLGKYVTKWSDNQKSHGLFIALPGVNSHAKGFYNDNMANNPNFTLKLYEQEKILDTVIDALEIINPREISKLLPQDIGKTGDWILLYSNNGPFWIQYIIAKGTGFPSKIVLLDGKGSSVNDQQTYDYLVDIYPEIKDFQRIKFGTNITSEQSNLQNDVEPIVEVRGSTECFEYQFPASPEYFVGRESLLNEFEKITSKIINKETSSRGILFLANSGWGKSSLVLSCVSNLQKNGHFAVAIDSRSASSSQFILRVIDYILTKFGDFNGSLPDKEIPEAITGFDGAFEALIKIGNALEKSQKILLISLDQFENVFFLQDTLNRVRDLFLRVCDSKTNIVFSFSWKTDLIGSTNEFPYQIRDSITESSQSINLETFSETEINMLLDRLASELHTTLRKDLRFFLSEFSQGYPWLLKKLCAHVKSQRNAGVQQSDIARTLLNVEELFKQDMLGLSAEEEETLRQIAKSAPINVLELGEKFRPEIVQSLVNRRLVVRIASKYDIYWDIFRDYLNTGRLPIQENYILRAQVRTVLTAITHLRNANNTLEVSTFRNNTNLSEKSFHNVARDLGLLRLAILKDGKLTLQINLPNEESEATRILKEHLQTTLHRNRLVWRISKELDEKRKLSLDDISQILQESCPYISATNDTWRTYARILSSWIDYTDIAILDTKQKELIPYEPGTDIRDRSLLLPTRRGAITPKIQYKPIEDIIIRLVTAVQGDGTVNWSGIAKSTIFKALGALEDIGFIVRKPQFIQVARRGIEFVENKDKRSQIFTEGACNINMFKVFINLLNDHKNEKLSNKDLAFKLRNELGADWKDGTALVNVKIMINWVKNTDYAHLANRKRGKVKKHENQDQIPLL